MDGNDSRPDWRVIVMAALFWFVAVTWLLASYLLYCRYLKPPFLEQGFCLYNALSYKFFCCFASIKPYWMQICPFLVSFLTFFPPWYVGVKRKFEHVLPCFMPWGMVIWADWWLIGSKPLGDTLFVQNCSLYQQSQLPQLLLITLACPTWSHFRKTTAIRPDFGSSIFAFVFFVATVNQRQGDFPWSLAGSLAFSRGNHVANNMAALATLSRDSFADVYFKLRDILAWLISTRCDNSFIHHFAF